LNQKLVSKKAWQGFLNGLKIITQVKYSNKQLLVIGSGPWPQKIKSILNANNHQVKINSIGARDFLSIDTNSIESYVSDQIVWIATIPTIQL
jgi:hypothetical protein